MFWYRLKRTVTNIMSPRTEFSLLYLLMPSSKIRGPLKALCRLSVKLPAICLTQVQDHAAHVFITKPARHSPRKKKMNRVKIKYKCTVLSVSYHVK